MPPKQRIAVGAALPPSTPMQLDGELPKGWAPVVASGEVDAPHPERIAGEFDVPAAGKYRLVLVRVQA